MVTLRWMTRLSNFYWQLVIVIGNCSDTQLNSASTKVCGRLSMFPICLNYPLVFGWQSTWMQN